jgi:putative flippase GtrA
VVGAVFPRRLRGVTDPMTGFFAVRRAAVDLDSLNPIGFKILLEILVRTPGLRIREVPFSFATRHDGESKANAVEGLRFLRQIGRLEWSRIAAHPHGRRAGRVIAFGLVGLSGILVNTLLLWALASPEGLGLNYLLAAVLATQGSTTWNFLLTDLLVFRSQRRGHVARRFIHFALLNNIVLLARLPVMALLVERLGVNYLMANVFTLALAFALRFFVSDRFIYGAGDGDDAAAPPHRSEDLPMANAASHRIDRRTDDSNRPPTELASAESRSNTGYLPYRYRIHNLVTIGSVVPLRELDYFADQAQSGPYDIEIRVGTVGPKIRRRSRLTSFSSPAAVRYEEHLGRLAANFVVSMDDDRIRVVVTPFLARSPHVVYTNIVEALLRFLTVDRGSMLLHSACVEIGGRGIMLSAKTDTGKTGTILRLVRDRGARFLSDDMTILSPGAWASSYPKPLTISNHTLRAVDPGDLSRREWQVLKFKSRVHSKEGRTFGLRLAEMNLPIVSINAFTQMVVPPPKYHVDRLVPVDIIAKTQIEAMFVIERGSPGLFSLDRDAALDELIVNTDDAYGFPPFSEFAPTIVLGGSDYAELRLKERAILRQAMTRVAMWRLASDSFSWADEIPDLLNDPRVVPTAPLEGLTLDLRGTVPFAESLANRDPSQGVASARSPQPE